MIANAFVTVDGVVQDPGLGGPADDPMAPSVAADAQWIQPIPDSLLDPATIVTVRKSPRIALIATLQLLPGRQRAVFVLRDVLSWPATDVADQRERPAGGGRPPPRRPYGLLVLTVTSTGIAAIAAFGDPDLVSRFR